MPLGICTVPNEQGNAVRDTEVPKNWQPKRVGATFGWDKKATEQRNPNPQTPVSAKKDKTRQITAARPRFADYL